MACNTVIYLIISFYSPNGKRNELLFDGLDDPEKIKSIKGLTSMWLEETTEFTKRDFIEVDLCLREPGPSYKQIIISFNPDEAVAPWLKKEFFDTKNPNAYIHNSTIEDNPIEEVRDEYRKQLDRLTDASLLKIYRFGQWAMPKGQIYSWDVVDKPKGEFYDEIFYGLDFGYSVDPAALDRIYRKADEFWLEEVIHELKLTNQQLGLRMREKGITEYEDIYADSAEPKSIDEIAEMRFNIKPCQKGADSVRAGIDYLKSQKIHIIVGSMNIISERNTYKWKEDKNGDPLPEPVKFNDHHMDADRYGIYTHCRMPELAYAAQVGGAVY